MSDKRKKLIRDMKIGDSGFTMDWAILREYPNTYDYCIRTDYPISEQSGGTSNTEIRMLSTGYIIFPVDNSKPEHYKTMAGNRHLPTAPATIIWERVK